MSCSRWFIKLKKFSNNIVKCTQKLKKNIFDLSFWHISLLVFISIRIFKYFIFGLFTSRVYEWHKKIFKFLAKFYKKNDDSLHLGIGLRLKSAKKRQEQKIQCFFSSRNIKI